MKTLHVATLPALRHAFGLIESAWERGPDGSRHFAELVHLMTAAERAHRRSIGGRDQITIADAVKVLILSRVCQWHVRPQDMPAIKDAHRVMREYLHLAGMYCERGSAMIEALQRAGYDVASLACLDYAEAKNNPRYFKGQ